MSIEEAMMGGIVFKGKKEKPKEENKIKTKAKKKTYITGLHGSGAAKMKAEIRRKRANRHKGKTYTFFFIPYLPELQRSIEKLSNQNAI